MTLHDVFGVSYSMDGLTGELTWTYLVILLYIQMLQSDCVEKATDVDEVRESAVHVMSQGNRYTSMVEPELTYLNQRWAELTQRIKVNLICERNKCIDTVRYLLCILNH